MIILSKNDLKKIEEAYSKVISELLRLSSHFKHDSEKLNALTDSLSDLTSVKRAIHGTLYISSCKPVEIRDFLFTHKDERYEMEHTSNSFSSDKFFKSFRLRTDSIFSHINKNCNSKKIDYVINRSYKDYGQSEWVDIFFDEKQNISSLIFVGFNSISPMHYDFRSMYVNKEFSLGIMNIRDYKYGQFKEYEFNIFQTSLNEIIDIIDLKLSKNEQVQVLLPELFIPSAYQFNSEDLKNRMILAEIIKI